MAFSLELYFDSEFEQKIVKLWDLLSARGLPSIMQTIGSRPHLAISILDEIDEEGIPGILQFIEGRYKPFDLFFPAVSVIPDGHGAVVLSPVLNDSLAAIQRGAHAYLVEKGLSPRPFYRPGQWLPHCTISKELPLEDCLDTIGISARASVTGKAKVVAVGVIEFRPRRELGSCRLGE